MGCHDQRWPNRLRRFSSLLIALIATVGLWPVVFILRDRPRPRRRGDVHLGATRGTLSIRGRVCYHAAWRLPRGRAVPGTDRAHERTAYQFQL
jgi:hypothetical protein